MPLIFTANSVNDGVMELKRSATGTLFSAKKTCSDFNDPDAPALISTGITLFSIDTR